MLKRKESSSDKNALGQVKQKLLQLTELCADAQLKHSATFQQLQNALTEYQAQATQTHSETNALLETALTLLTKAEEAAANDDITMEHEKEAELVEDAAVAVHGSSVVKAEKGGESVDGADSCKEKRDDENALDTAEIGVTDVGSGSGSMQMVGDANTAPSCTHDEGSITAPCPPTTPLNETYIVPPTQDSNCTFIVSSPKQRHTVHILKEVDEGSAENGGDGKQPQQKKCKEETDDFVLVGDDGHASNVKESNDDGVTMVCEDDIGVREDGDATSVQGDDQTKSGDGPNKCMEDEHPSKEQPIVVEYGHFRENSFLEMAEEVEGIVGQQLQRDSDVVAQTQQVQEEQSPKEQLQPRNASPVTAVDELSGIALVRSTFLRNITVTFSGLSAEQRENIADMIHKMGGRVSDQQHPFTHLIAEKCDPQSTKYDLSRRFKLPVVLPSWAYAAAEANDLETLNAVLTNKFIVAHKTPLFAHCQITVSGFLGSERSDIGHLVEANGGVFTGQMNRASCTHLIAAKSSGEKYRRAREWGSIKVVSFRWLRKSIAMGYRLPEDRFSIDSDGEEGWPSSADDDDEGMSTTPDRKADVGGKGDKMNPAAKKFKMDTPIVK